MGRSRSEYPTDADLAAELFAASCEDRVQADAGPGGCADRKLYAGRIGRMAATSRQDPERSSRSCEHGLAGLSPTDAAGLVRPVRAGPHRPAATSAERAG